MVSLIGPNCDYYPADGSPDSIEKCRLVVEEVFVELSIKRYAISENERHVVVNQRIGEFLTDDVSVQSYVQHSDHSNFYGAQNLYTVTVQTLIWLREKKKKLMSKEYKLV